MTNAPIDYQVIERNGVPEYAVVPYDDFVALLEDKGLGDLLTIPQEVVELRILGKKSLARAWREHLGLTQEEVAGRMGASQAALSQMERRGAALRPTTLRKLAAALGVHVEQLKEA